MPHFQPDLTHPPSRYDKIPINRGCIQSRKGSAYPAGAFGGQVGGAAKRILEWSSAGRIEVYQVRKKRKSLPGKEACTRQRGKDQ